MANIQDKILTGDSQNKEWRNFDKQLLFDGVNDRIQTIELTQDVRVGKSFTAAMWVNSKVYNASLTPGSLQDYLFYAYSSNNTAGAGQIVNEIICDNVFFAGENFIRVNILTRNGALDNVGGFAILGNSFPILSLNEVFHICITNDWDGNENNWKLYLNGVKAVQGVTQFINNGAPLPPKSGIALPLDPNYISGFGFAKNRDTLATSYMNNSVNEAIFANVAITGEDVRKLFHCSAGDYANYPANLMNNRILHLPMNDLGDFIDNGIGNPISVKNLATGGDSILTGQTFPPTLTNFY